MKRRSAKEIVRPPEPSMVLTFQTIIIIQHLLAIRNTTMYMAGRLTPALGAATPLAGALPSSRKL